MKELNTVDLFCGADGDDDSWVHPLTEPMPTQHSGGNRCAVVRPFLVRMNRNCTAEDVDAPLSTTTVAIRPTTADGPTRRRRTTTVGRIAC